MDADRFVAAYTDYTPSEYASLSKAEWKRVHFTMFSDPIMIWSRFFSTLVDYTLNNEPVNPDEAAEEIEHYTSDTMRHLAQGIIRTTRDAATQHPHLPRQLNQLNFHAMNQEFGPMWHRFSNPELLPLTEEQLITMQARLSMKALELVRFREQTRASLKARAAMLGLHLQDYMTSGDIHLDQSLVGQITEFDTSVSLLEMIKDDNGEQKSKLFVMPAPPKYEAKRGKSADFLLYDAREEQAHGIQAKTTLQERDTDIYDAGYVSMIDGITDLGNYAVSQHPSGMHIRKPMPGLISAAFVLDRKPLLESNALRGLAGMRGQLSNVALPAAYELEPYLNGYDGAANAVRMFGDRVLQALYAQPSDSPEDSPRSAME